MSILIQALHWLSGLVVLSEALNKLERTPLLSRDMRPNARLVLVLKAVAWFFLALGAGGALASPLLIAMGFQNDNGQVLLRLEKPTLSETLVLLGFAVLIVRTRIKEG
jgi:hypothetical protein